PRARRHPRQLLRPGRKLALADPAPRPAATTVELRSPGGRAVPALDDRRAGPAAQRYEGRRARPARDLQARRAAERLARQTGTSAVAVSAGATAPLTRGWGEDPRRSLPTPALSTR